VNTPSEYNVSLRFAPEFSATQPAVAELDIVEAFIPELMAALLDAAPVDED
jgi:hypothetical protein